MQVPLPHPGPPCRAPDRPMGFTGTGPSGIDRGPRSPTGIATGSSDGRPTPGEPARGDAQASLGQYKITNV